MTEPNDPDLIALATPYALHAVPEAELAEIERLVAAAPPDVAEAFADEVRAVRETMAVVSAATAVDPPDQLRDRLLIEVSSDPVRSLGRRIKRWQTIGLAAAAAVVIGLGALAVGMRLQPTPTPTTAEQVLAAPDVRTVSGPLPIGGTATVIFSREKNAGLLVMNDVAPPKPGTVYQMWLINDKGPRSAGTMESKNVTPAATAVLSDLGDARTLAFTVEPPGGSAQPTRPPFAKVPLA
jgi:anti-sigma-K factor RskA